MAPADGKPNSTNYILILCQPELLTYCSETEKLEAPVSFIII